METNNNSVTIHINVKRENIEQFEKLYPRCRRRFIENAIRSANLSKDIFDRIFFMDLLK